MNYQLISNLGVDLADQLEESLGIELIPFIIQVEGKDFVGKSRSQVQKMREEMNASKEAVKTSYPSPYDYQKAFDPETDGIFIITVSSRLSGSYNSTNLGVKKFQEKHPQTRVHIFDSRPASAGETNLAYYIKSLMNQGLTFEEIVERRESFTREMETFFIPESLDDLVKNGRIKKSAGLIAKALSIKPIMRGVREEIKLFELNRGFKKSLDELAKALGRVAGQGQGYTLYINHFNAEDKIQLFKGKILGLYQFDDVVMVPTGGLPSAYVDDGGTIISF